MTRVATSFSKEQELLIGCARTHLEPHLLHFDPSLDWDKLISAAWSHGVLPLVYWNLRESIPETIRDRIRRRFEENARSNLTRTGELVSLVSLFEASGIRSIPYKGPVLAVSSYGNLALRQFVDLDILVDRSEVRRAKRLLLDRGYEPDLKLDGGAEDAYLNSQFEYNFHRGDVHVEIHWNILPQYFNIAVPHSALWNRAGKVRLAHRDVPCLSPEDTMLVLCLHGGKHSWERLGWIADVAETIRAFPHLRWDWIYDCAHRSGDGILVDLGLHLAQRLLGAPLPSHVTRRFGSAVRRLTAYVLSSLFENQSARQLRRAWFYLDAKRGFWNRVRYALRLALSPTEREWQWLRLPRVLWGLYGGLRPFRLLSEHALSRRRA